MSFKYINPGYIKFIGTNSDLKQYTDNDKKYTRNGVYFNTRSYLVYDVILTDAPSTDEFWLKADFYLSTADSISFRLGKYSGGQTDYFTGVMIEGQIKANYDLEVRAYTTNSGSSASTYCTLLKTQDLTVKQRAGFVKNAINSVLAHIKAGESGTGFVEIFINTHKLGIYYPNHQISWTQYYNGQYTKTFYLKADSYAKISNLIISDEEIDPRETIIELPVSSTAATMSYNSETGIYTADAAGENLLQTVDVSELAEKYGDASSVTGIAIIGDPAYRTTDALTSITVLSSKNNSVTEHNKFLLSTDSNTGVFDSWKLESDTTILDLQGTSYGWKAE